MSGVLGPALHLLTGKGGVGKTTLALGLALEAQARGGKPVVVELGHRSSLASAAGRGGVAIGHDARALVGNVHASNVSLEHALTDYLARRVRSRTVARGITRSGALRTFFDAAPAVPEILTLEHIEALARRFDPVIVDLDATGHALMFLELPGLLARIAPRGPVGELVRSLGALLTDRARTRIHLVTLAAALPIEETLTLAAELSSRACPLGAIVVNRRAARPIEPGDDAHARALERAEGASARDREALRVAREDAARWDDEERGLTRLDATGLARVVLGELESRDEHLALAQIAALGKTAAEAIA
jgi:anion-transporting  ArsA/GET3 family ATPase